MLNFNNNDNMQVQGLTAQVQSTPGFDQINQDMVSKAWDFSKSKANTDGVHEDDPAYWDTITNQTKQALGMQLPNSPKTDDPMNLQTTVAPINPQQTTANMNTGNRTVVENKERVKEIQTSAGFSAAPENAVVPGMKGQTGSDINSEAKKRLELMKSHGFGTSF